MLAALFCLAIGFLPHATALNLLQIHADVAPSQGAKVKHKSKLQAVRAAKYYTADWKTGKQKLVFVHIPKNGGTAIEEAGAKGKIWWPRKWLSFWHGITMPDQSSCEKYHVPPHFLDSMKEPDADVFAEETTFCVTRNPYDRAVSEYLYMLEKPWGPSMSRQYKTALLEKPRCTVEGLNHFLQTAASRVLEGRRYVHDCHFVPQSEYIWGPDGRKWCHHILKQENLTEQFNELMESNGFNVHIRDGKTNNSTKTCEHINVDALSLTTRRMLDDVYRDDFDKLGYERTQKPLLYLHIPKTAGQEIEDAALKVGIKYPLHTEKFQHRFPMADYSWCQRYHVPPEYLPSNERSIFEESEMFCVTRHPYERALNEYRFLISSKEGQKMSDYYDTGLTEIGEKCSAEQLNFFLQRTVQLLNAGQAFALDCRMIPQVQFIWGSDGKQWCNHVIKGEKLPQAFNHLMEHQGYSKIQLEAAPKSLDATSASECPQLSESDLSNETKAMLNKYYAEDFYKLDYVPM